MHQVHGILNAFSKSPLAQLNCSLDSQTRCLPVTTDTTEFLGTDFFIIHVSLVKSNKL